MKDLMTKTPPHTKWIKPKDLKQSEWIKAQCLKRNISETDYSEYMNLGRFSKEEIELKSKSKFRDMENCWNAEQSRKKKATLTISKKAQKRIQTYCKKKSISPTQLIDSYTATLGDHSVADAISQRQNNRNEVAAEIHQHAKSVADLRSTLMEVRDLAVTAGISSFYKEDGNQPTMDSLTKRIDESEKILDGLLQFLIKVDKSTDSNIL
jgi:hypothetical protein